MSEIINKRRLMESVHALVKTRQIDAGQIVAVMASFEAVINDVSDEPMALELDTMAEKAAKIESMQGDMLKARSILLRWCSDSMNDTQTKRLRQKTLEFCAVKA